MVSMSVMNKLTMEEGIEEVVSAWNPTNGKSDEEKKDTNLDVRREDETKEEYKFQNKIRAMKEGLEKAWKRIVKLLLLYQMLILVALYLFFVILSRIENLIIHNKFNSLQLESPPKKLK